jgi:copper(I)-binding protein
MMLRFGPFNLLQSTGTTRLLFKRKKEIMKKSNRFGWMLAALLISFASHAASNAGGIEISGAWSRATAPGQDAASVDMTITSKRPASLVGASSPACKAVQLHSMVMKSGMMIMREVKTIELPAGKRVNLHDNGYHLMMVGLKAPLKEGERVPVTLNVKVGKHRMVEIKTSAKVTSLTSAGAPPDDREQMHMKMN